jgi:TPR repeat protein
MKKLFAGIALAALMGCAQLPAGPSMSPEAAAQRHADGLAFQKSGNDKAAFAAFLDAAEHGHPPAQRRLGEIYDTGNSAVERDYVESIRWYQAAREGGEQLPAQPKIPHSPTNPTSGIWY